MSHFCHIFVTFLLQLFIYFAPNLRNVIAMTRKKKERQKKERHCEGEARSNPEKKEIDCRAASGSQ
jgi:hypothetical protein